jgi:hypothetical protein
MSFGIVARLVIVPKEHLKMARRFNAGLRIGINKSWRTSEFGEIESSAVPSELVGFRNLTRR